MTAIAEREAAPLPPALCSRNPFAWLTIFGPGAVIASLTIGAGELIFSSRAGALFGYRLIWFFVLVLLLKWVLVFATARHMILTGAHPLQRWMDLPGPRGWFPMVFLLLALIAFPIWVGFHAGTLGTLLAWLTGTASWFHNGAHLLWGMALLGVVMALVVAGGYATLERIQLAIVAAMLVCVVVSLILLKPDWLALLKGLFVPQALEYPAWASLHPELAARPVWVETITYVGVLGGSGYDYLAYASYLRSKQWGNAASTTPMDPGQVDRRWMRALWIDSILSFVAVLIFAIVFVAAGAKVLAPQHQVPGGTNLLTLQAAFVSPLYPWLQPLYFVGAFLAIFGTLYGTIEVAPPVLREFLNAFRPADKDRQVRGWAIWWVGLGGFVVVAWSFGYHLFSGGINPPGLIKMLTPANLFTGVLACGFICALSLWTDKRFLPCTLQMRWPLRLLLTLAALVFLALGIKGYWDQRMARLRNSRSHTGIGLVGALAVAHQGKSESSSFQWQMNTAVALTSLQANVRPFASVPGRRTVRAIDRAYVRERRLPRRPCRNDEPSPSRCGPVPRSGASRQRKPARRETSSHRSFECRCSTSPSVRRSAS
jgi:Mn2+/Fe2+ NRAMP family transporter